MMNTLHFERRNSLRISLYFTLHLYYYVTLFK